MKKVMVMLFALAVCLALLLVPAARAESGTRAAPVIDLTALCNAAIAVLCALVTYRLIPWIKARASTAQQEALRLAVRTAVYAAEQLYKTNVIADRLRYAEKWLQDRGYKADRAQIEAQVKQLAIDSGFAGVTLTDCIEFDGETEEKQEDDDDDDGE